MQNLDLTDRVAIVTGGSQGIGRGICLALAEAGASVVVAARTRERVEAVRDEVRALGRAALAVPTDVTRPDRVEELVKATLREFGRVDILVNNAGGSYGPTFNRGPLLQLSEQDWDECIALNARSVFLCSKAVAPIMLERQRGSIINISSTAVRQSETTRVGFAHYGAAKAAVLNLTYSMANEWAPHVRVNCVLPGFVASQRSTASRSSQGVVARLSTVALGRPGQPEDIAAAVVFLASDAAAYVTGAALDVHGGVKSNLPPSPMVSRE